MLRQAKILVIDDDPALLEALPETLAFNLTPVVRVEAIACPIEAVQKVQGVPYDVVICDLAMPRMDGMAVLKHLQTTCPHTKFILMTGHFNQEIQTAARQAGAYACVPKPIERIAFLGIVKQALATVRDNHCPTQP